MNASKAVLRTATGEHPSVVYESFVLNKRDAYVWWAYVRLGSMEDAREVANDALFKIYLRWDDVLASASTDAFGWKVLRDAVVDMLRKRDRRPSTPVGLAFEPSARPVAGTPDEEIEHLSMRMEIHAAVNTLPARQRTCVSLHYFLGFPVEEIASMTGIADSTVRSHLASARSTLAHALGVPDEPAAYEKGTTDD